MGDGKLSPTDRNAGRNRGQCAPGAHHEARSQDEAHPRSLSGSRSPFLSRPHRTGQKGSPLAPRIVARWARRGCGVHRRARLPPLARRAPDRGLRGRARRSLLPADRAPRRPARHGASAGVARDRRARARRPTSPRRLGGTRIRHAARLSPISRDSSSRARRRRAFRDDAFRGRARRRPRVFRRSPSRPPRGARPGPGLRGGGRGRSSGRRRHPHAVGGPHPLGLALQGCLLRPGRGRRDARRSPRCRSPFRGGPRSLARAARERGSPNSRDRRRERSSDVR